MYIQINTDNQIASDAERDARLEEQVRQRLARFEARVNGLQPVAVADEGASIDRAVIGAAKKAVRALDHQLGKVDPRRSH